MFSWKTEIKSYEAATTLNQLNDIKLLCVTKENQA